MNRGRVEWLHGAHEVQDAIVVGIGDRERDADLRNPPAEARFGRDQL